MPVTSHVCDFETASGVDLNFVGAWAYAAHPTTEVLCFSFETPWGVQTWHPNDSGAGEFLMNLVNDPSAMFVSHGDFERAIWHHQMVAVHGFPPLPNERWNDTMAIAAQKQLPLELGALLRALKLPHEKDKEGRALTVSLSKPNKKTGMLDRSPATLARVYQYCESDIGGERGVLDRIGFLQRGERRVWLLDQKINQRGVKIDRAYVAACQKIVDEATEPLAAEFTQITGGLSFTQRDRIMGWLKAEGVSLPDLQKPTLAAVLGKDIDAGEDGDEDDFDPGAYAPVLPAHVRRALEIRQLVGSAAIKKLARMAACVNSDGRARGLLQYHRAGPGRWAGRLIQPQNFPRPTDTMRGIPADVLVPILMSGDYEYVQAMLGAPIETVVGALRHALVADEGKRFISGDFSTIEARIVLALAGQHDKIDLFRRSDAGEKGPDGKKIDVYNDMASKIYGRPIDRKGADQEEGQTGKNSVLGCGFQMGWQKFKARYAKGQPDEFAQGVIDTYRTEWAPEVPKVWAGLEEAALKTAWDRTPHEAYGVLYQLEGGWMTARLPSGRKLFYWNPQPCKKEMPWSTPDRPDIRDAWSYQAIKMGQFKTIDAYGGLLTENVVQGLARDLLVGAMFRLEENGFPLVLTVHDEAVAEVDEALADEVAFRQIMVEGEVWSRGIGLPINSETWAGLRYRK